jgi:hypothetical protein
MTRETPDPNTTDVTTSSTVTDPSFNGGAGIDSGELVQVRLRREWYAHALRAVGDQDRDDDLLILLCDLLIEVACALAEAAGEA